ncbi:MAG: FkbM family methyltransferase [Actinomycetota bacterium]|nr:FkbM family methyltransferase [Actinomycetota bacterium]
MLVLSSLVRPGDICVDVGAAGGTYLYLLSRLVGESGRVYAFEPRAGSYRFLERMCRRLRLRNVSVHRLALAESPRPEPMLMPKRSGIPFTTRAFLRRGLDSHTSGYYPEFTSSRQFLIQATTLDRFVEENRVPRVDFVKCDVEGAELWALQGAAATIGAHRPILLCEIEDRHLGKYGLSSSDLMRWLRQYTYSPFAFRSGRLSEVGGVTPDENNYLFLPRSPS